MENYPVLEKITDLSYLTDVAAGDREFLFELVETFIRQVSEFTDNMKLYLREGKYELLAKEAHTAKSSVILFGLHRLGSRLKEFQLLAQEMDRVESYPEYIAEFEETCRLAIEEIRESLDL